MASKRRLGRPTDQRMLMLRNLVTSLLDKGRIVTTVTRAKEARSLAEEMITLAKKGDLHSRRRAL
ncbi:MAG TPA: bL17 family ribosomal protein, partial [Bacillota bacterium]|nr:bL17 family ribosomal protein [Bacillota bacterium]